MGVLLPYWNVLCFGWTSSPTSPCSPLLLKPFYPPVFPLLLLYYLFSIIFYIPYPKASFASSRVPISSFLASTRTPLFTHMYRKRGARVHIGEGMWDISLILFAQVVSLNVFEFHPFSYTFHFSLWLTRIPFTCVPQFIFSSPVDGWFLILTTMIPAAVSTDGQVPL